MATAVYQKGTIAILQQRWNLITPIAAVPETSVQQYHSWAGTISGIPDSCTRMFNVSITIWKRQWFGTLSLEPQKVVIVCFHLISGFLSNAVCEAVLVEIFMLQAVSALEGP
jgi:hypothetical protein